MAELGDYSEVSVANLALQHQGRGALIVDMGENTQAARVMKLHLPYARDAVTRSYPWNFAKARASLPALGTTPTFEFSHQFQLPTDPKCLRVLRVDGMDDMDWRVEGGLLLCNDAGPIDILYLKRVTSLIDTDPLFIQALAARLAADTAMTLTESSGKADTLWRVYQAKLREARAVDAQEGQRDMFPSGDWDSVRYQGTVAPYRDWRGT